jgi:hypothetical protein
MTKPSDRISSAQINPNSDKGEMNMSDNNNNTMDQDLVGLVKDSEPEVKDESEIVVEKAPGVYFHINDSINPFPFAMNYRNPLWVEGAPAVVVHTTNFGWKLGRSWMNILMDLHTEKYTRFSLDAFERNSGNIVVNLKGAELFNMKTKGHYLVRVPGFDDFEVTNLPEAKMGWVELVILSKRDEVYQFGGAHNGFQVEYDYRLSQIAAGSCVYIRELASKTGSRVRVQAALASDKLRPYVYNGYFYWKQAHLNYVRSVIEGTVEESRELQATHRKSFLQGKAIKGEIRHEVTQAEETGEAIDVSALRLRIDPEYAGKHISANGTSVVEENGDLWLVLNQLDSDVTLVAVNAKSGMLQTAISGSKGLKLNPLSPDSYALAAIKTNCNPEFTTWRPIFPVSVK